MKHSASDNGDGYGQEHKAEDECEDDFLPHANAASVQDRHGEHNDCRCGLVVSEMATLNTNLRRRAKPRLGISQGLIRQSTH